MSPEHKTELFPEGVGNLRVLGNCSACDAQDTIVRQPGETFKEWKQAGCESCGTIWPDWLALVWEQRNKGNNLIPVGIERLSTYGGVRVIFPREIPHSGLVTSVFNAALIARFNLGVCFATEGGVQGRYKGSYIELRNHYDNLGLWNERAEYSRGKEVVEILDFYRQLVGLLLEEDFTVGKKHYRRGEILRLPEEEQTTEKTWEILVAILIKARSRKFAQKVIKELVANSSNPFSAPYLRGLTPEEIVKFFVPPPLE